MVLFSSFSIHPIPYRYHIYDFKLWLIFFFVDIFIYYIKHYNCLFFKNKNNEYPIKFFLIKRVKIILPI